MILTTPMAKYFVTIPVFVGTNLQNRETLPGLAVEGKYRIAVIVAKAMEHCDQDLETTPLISVVVFGSIGVMCHYCLPRPSQCPKLATPPGGGKGGGAAAPSFGAPSVAR